MCRGWVRTTLSFAVRPWASTDQRCPGWFLRQHWVQCELLPLPIVTVPMVGAPQALVLVRGLPSAGRCSLAPAHLTTWPWCCIAPASSHPASITALRKSGGNGVCDTFEPDEWRDPCATMGNNSISAALQCRLRSCRNWVRALQGLWEGQVDEPVFNSRENHSNYRCCAPPPPGKCSLSGTWSPLLSPRPLVSGCVERLLPTEGKGRQNWVKPLHGISDSEWTVSKSVWSGPLPWARTGFQSLYVFCRLFISHLMGFLF